MNREFKAKKEEDMKIVFFDMEFANGKIPGSVYSLGYVQTNGRFELTEPQTDLLMNPDCEWNAYVRSHILAYSMSTVKAASLFPSYYKRLKKLLCHADLVVGFAVKNDTTVLEKACERYGLKPLDFQCLDMERLCKSLKDYPQAHGLAGYVRAYCGVDPDHQHRSDGDAYATMMLLREICKRRGIPTKRIKKEFAAYLLPSIAPTPKKIRHKQEAETEDGADEARLDGRSSRTDSSRVTLPGPKPKTKKRNASQNGQNVAQKNDGEAPKSANGMPKSSSQGGNRMGTRRRHHHRHKRTTLPKSAMPQATNAEKKE